MAPDSKIAVLIEKALAAGIPHESLVGMLSARGWPEREIYNALAGHYERSAGLEIPRRAGAGASAKEAFYYLLVFSTLGTWTFGLGSLAFALIDRWLPDQLFANNYDSFNINAVSFSIAAILVAFPLFLLVSRATAKEITLQPERLDSPVRKWLTYLALVIAACVFMVDLIGAIALLLRGELTSRFLCRAAAVLVISGGTFANYFAGLRKTDEASLRSRRGRSAAAIASVVVVLVLALGFWQLGAPPAQRALRADGRRVQDLYQLSSEIANYWNAHGSRLPASLDQISGARYSDPVTHAPYTYLPGQTSHYQLCAVFARASFPAQAGASPDEWDHPAGSSCFQLDATARTTYPSKAYAY